MNISTKLLQAAAGSAGGAGLDVDEVFSTFLYTGSSSAQTINNGIDLSGEGGLVWIKERSTSGSDHHLTDTVRGIKNPLNSDSTAAENTYYANNNQGITAFNNNGFTVASGSNFNDNGDTAVSWTFRKAINFCDIVTYTGNGTAGLTVNHNLGSVPGMIIVKGTGLTSHWQVLHRNDGTNWKNLQLDQTGASGYEADYWGNGSSFVAPTSTAFTVGTGSNVNANGYTYVAYLFAHNNNDGGFGPDSDQDIIKCGSFTPPSSGETEVTLGFEPQFIITFDTGGGDNWRMYDTMRGWDVVNRQLLNPNQSVAESSLSNTSGYEIKPTATGFIHEGHTASSPHIYMAIRRGPLAAPTDATKVFAVQDGRGASKLYTAGFPVDAFLQGNKNGDNWQFHSRLTRGKVLATDTTAAETTDTFYYFDDQTGIVTSSGGGSALTQLVAYMWKRAPSYFDVCCYTGNSTQGRTVSHNLGAIPEMMWIKSRSNADGWKVYHKDTGATKYLTLNDTSSETTDTWINNTAPTDSVFTLGGSGSGVNYSGLNYIAYLFASAPGVSKVGSFTGSDSDQTIDCGFSSGARFVLLKCTTDTNNWAVWDTARGIVSGNEPYLVLDRSDAEITGQDRIDPHSSGFTVAGNFTTGNDAGQSYIFYAIA